MKTSHTIAASLFTAMLAAGCASVPPAAPSAEARLQPTQGHTARGVVSFAQKGDEVVVTALFSGLTPGDHGFHIHEKGDCSAPDATSAGGHFNPGDDKHGNPHKGEHHAGDLPMLKADANGNASLTTTVSGITLGKGEANILGRAVIVHAAPDDFKTQPTGNSGARVACGIIATR